MNDYIIKTNFWKVILSNDQMYIGRLVIVSVAPRESLSELSLEEQLDFFVLIKKLEYFYKDTFQATMFNYSCLMNNAYRDGDTPHVHFHFRPRYKSPIIILGQTFTDPNFGEHYISPTLLKQQATNVKDEIKDYISNKMIEYFK